MVQQRGRSILAGVEEKLGLPPLSQMAGAFEKFPDTKQLHQIKAVLAAAESVSRIAPELDKAVALIQEINSMPMEKLDKLEKLLKRIEKIMKNSPKELVDFLISLKE